MLDVFLLELRAGNGGSGKVSFRREKYIPKGGPDGGDGGDGGSVIVRANRHLVSLKQFAGKRIIEAKAGQSGGKRKKIGKASEDIVVEVPVGTTLWLVAENEISRKRQIESSKLEGSKRFRRNTKYFLEIETEPIPPIPVDEIEIPVQLEDKIPTSYRHLKRGVLDELKHHKLVTLTEHGQEEVIVVGGEGGKGNTAFKGSAKTTPLEAEAGVPGEAKLILFEVELLADVGLVGYPNAGKSTLIARLTKADPKIASYPFTTLEPQLGMLEAVDRAILVADIPGLIDGASEGKGLGFEFLRHIKHCEVLLFMVAVDEELLWSEISEEEQVEAVFKQYDALLKELEQYDAGLLKKKRVLALTKQDLLSEGVGERFLAAAKNRSPHPKNIKSIVISSATGYGLEELTELLRSQLG